MLMQILESSSDREEWQVGIPDTESPAQEKEQLEGESNSQWKELIGGASDMPFKP